MALRCRMPNATLCWDGLDAAENDNDLVGWLDTLAQHDQLSASLAVTNQAIGAELDPATAVRLGLVEPLSSLLSRSGPHTDGDIVEVSRRRPPGPHRWGLRD